MYGTIQAKPRGATDYVTCDWEVGTVTFSNTTVKSYASSYFSTSTATFGPVTRKNVAVEAGCGVGPTDTWFLPQKLQFKYENESVLTQSGQAWYQGSSVSNSALGYFYGSDSACARSTYQGTWQYNLYSMQNVGSYLAYE